MLGVSACNLPQGSASATVGDPIQFLPIMTATMTPFQLAARGPNDPILSPTPDSLRALPTIRSEVINHTVQVNDTVGGIAYSYGVSIEDILQANALANPDVLSVGQVLVVPAPVFEVPGQLSRSYPTRNW